MFKNAIKILIAALMFTWLSSCKQPGSSSQLMRLEFEVDTSLLAEHKVIDSVLGIVFHPPKNWIESKIETSQLAEFPEHSFTVRHLYLNTEDSSTMLISRMTGFSNEQLALLRIDHQEVFKRDGLWDDIRHAAFRFNDFIADQFLMQNNNMVNFKLILTADGKSYDGEIFSLDFFLPRDHYIKNIKSVESSIGSVLLLN